MNETIIAKKRCPKTLLSKPVIVTLADVINETNTVNISSMTHHSL